MELDERVRAELLRLGADLAGFGDLTVLPPERRYGLPVGVSVAVAYPAWVIRGIAELPTPAYYEHYNAINVRLDDIVTNGAEFIRSLGFRAVAQTRGQVGFGEDSDSTALPHKTLARRAGLGWIGKCALLVNERYGASIRLSSIITDAPLTVAEPVTRPRCGGCSKCADECPAGAVVGNNWSPGIPRDGLVDPVKCRTAARERAMRGFGVPGVTICGKCIEACPYFKMRN